MDDSADDPLDARLNGPEARRPAPDPLHVPIEERLANLARPGLPADTDVGMAVAHLARVHALLSRHPRYQGAAGSAVANRSYVAGVVHSHHGRYRFDITKLD